MGDLQDTCPRTALLPRQQNANDLRSQSDKAIDSVSYPLYHVNEVFCLPSPAPHIYVGIKVVEK